VNEKGEEVKLPCLGISDWASIDKRWENETLNWSVERTTQCCDKVFVDDGDGGAERSSKEHGDGEEETEKENKLLMVVRNKTKVRNKGR